MESLTRLLSAQGVAGALSEQEGASLADALSGVAGGQVYARSIVGFDGTVAMLVRGDQGKSLAVLCSGNCDASAVALFEGNTATHNIDGQEVRVRTGPLSHANIEKLREKLSYLRPQVSGLATSAGLGDRLGLATPGHIHAIRGSGVFAFLSQQSIREMTRTNRTPEQVMDDAAWGVFQEGFRDGFGSDADHLKTTADIDICVAAGFTMFTIDPGDHVDDDADNDAVDALRSKCENLPWAALDTNMEDTLSRYSGKSLPTANAETIDEPALLRAFAKYGKAVAHTAAMYRHLADRKGGDPFELEMSVDETNSPTSALEHYIVASELKRLGVEWISLAPRFVGRFEKGVDYIGDLGQLEQAIADHAQIASALGPYKLSIHSGSDKFSAYPLFVKHCGGYTHLKTAGTSYLEAVRTIAHVDTALFREILDFAIQRYPEDKASYHVSADLGKVTAPSSLSDGDLPAVLDHFDSRQVLHCTFGSVLTTQKSDGSPLFFNRFMQTLKTNEDTHFEMLEAHLGRHIAPFARQ